VGDDAQARHGPAAGAGLAPALAQRVAEVGMAAQVDDFPTAAHCLKMGRTISFSETMLFLGFEWMAEPIFSFRFLFLSWYSFP
jgi:hypothetical protein